VYVRLSRSLTVVGVDMDRSESYDLLSVGLSRTVSEIDGDFGQKSQLFLTLRQFNAPSEGVPFGIW